ncbi:hypothetical protein PG988_009796 [Apiospora saccharicola]
MSLTVNVTIYSTRGHVDIQASPGADEPHLPESSSSVSKAKSGKPAVTPKKNKELLQKHGFDILGQSFGIPSRVDYEREFLVDTPPRQTARRRSLSVSTSDQDIEVYVDDSSSPPTKLKSAHRKGASPPSSETQTGRKLGQTATDPENLQSTRSSTKQEPRQRTRSMSQSTTSLSAKNSRKQMVMYKSDDDDDDTDSETTHSSTSFYLPPPPPSHNKPRQGHPAYTPTYPTMAGYLPAVYPVGGHGYHTTPGPAATVPLPGFYYSQPVPQYPQAAGFNMYSQGFVLNHPGSLPVPPQLPQHLPQQPLINMMPYIHPTANATTGPPPPPPVDHVEAASHGNVQAAANIDAAVSTGGNEATHDMIPGSGEQNNGPPLVGVPAQSMEPGSKTLAESSMKHQEKSTAKQNVKEPLSFPYKHVCAGCGKTRSNGYHMTHRLKNGESAEPDYCRQCVAVAAFTDSEAPSMDGRSQPFIPHGPPASTRSSGAESQIKKGHYVFDDRSRRHTLHKKPRRRSFLRSFLRASSTHRSLNDETKSISSAEEASSRASSPMPGHKLHRQVSLATTENSSQAGKLATPVTQSSGSTRHPKGGSRRSHLATMELTDARPGHQDEKENNPKPRTLPRSRVEHTTTSVADDGQAVPARMNMRYKQPTVRNEDSELTNIGLDSSAPDEVHTAMPTQSYGGLSYISSHASNERSGFLNIDSPAQGPPSNTTMDRTRSPPGSRTSKNNIPTEVEELPARMKPSGTGESPRAKRSTRSPDDTIFPKLTGSVRKDEYSPFGEYDSSPRDPVNGFGSAPRLQPTRPHQSTPLIPALWMIHGGLFDSSRQSSTASSNLFFGNLTPTLISIESCPSDEERTDGNDHYEMAAGNGSDEEEEYEDNSASKKSPKQLEYSSSEDRTHKTTSYNSYADNRHRDVKTTGYHMPDARNMYNNYDMESTISSHSSDFRPPADNSSLRAHTGHSMDGIPFPDTRAPRHRIRRLGGLLRP